MRPGRVAASILLLLAPSFAATDVAPGDPSIRYLGRTAKDRYSSAIQWSWSGSGAAITFDGTACAIRMKAPNAFFRILVDGRETGTLDLTGKYDTLFALATGLPRGIHTVAVRLRTECGQSLTSFNGFRIEGAPATAPAAPERRIEFYGNSITCGYGILDSVASNGFKLSTEDEGRTYAAIAADSLGAERHTICWSGRGVLQNYGGDTTYPTLPELFRQVVPWDTTLLWDFSLWTPQVVVVDLGTNDYSTASAQPDSAKFHRAYRAFLDSLRDKYPQARLVLLDGPMMSDTYPAGLNTLTKLRAHLDNLVAEMSGLGVRISHFSLSPQGQLGYGADYHPSLAQAALNGRELAAHLRTLDWTSSVTPGTVSRASSAVRIVAGRDGWSLVADLQTAAAARIVDAGGRVLGSLRVDPGIPASLPAARHPSWVRIEQPAGPMVVAIPPRLR